MNGSAIYTPVRSQASMVVYSKATAEVKGKEEVVGIFDTYVCLLVSEDVKAMLFFLQKQMYSACFLNTVDLCLLLN